LDRHRLSAAANARDDSGASGAPLKIPGEEVGGQQWREQVVNVEGSHPEDEVALDTRRVPPVLRNGPRRRIEEIVDVADIAVDMCDGRRLLGELGEVEGAANLDKRSRSRGNDATTTPSTDPSAEVSSCAVS
jgi:hypothetical protein